MSKVDLRLQCGMPCSKLEVSTAQHGTLSGTGYLHQSRSTHGFRSRSLALGIWLRRAKRWFVRSTRMGPSRQVASPLLRRRRSNPSFSNCADPRRAPQPILRNRVCHTSGGRQANRHPGFARAQTSSIPARTAACKYWPAAARGVNPAGRRAACLAPRSCVYFVLDRRFLPRGNPATS